MSRKRTAGISGTVTNDPLAIAGTTLTSAELASLPVVSSPDIMAIVLDPAGASGDPEIVHVTAHTSSATSATITRAQESTTAREHASTTVWLHGPTTQDYIPMGPNGDIRKVTEELSTDAASGTTHTIDLDIAPVHDITLTDNCTFTFSNPVATGKGSSFTLILRQDGTGSRTVTWPASVDWAAATAPTLTTTASAVDILTFFTIDGGTTWFGFTAGQAFA